MFLNSIISIDLHFLHLNSLAKQLLQYVKLQIVQYI